MDNALPKIFVFLGCLLLSSPTIALAEGFIYQNEFEGNDVPADMTPVSGFFAMVDSGSAGSGAIAMTPAQEGRARILKENLPLPVKYGIATQFVFGDSTSPPHPALPPCHPFPGNTCANVYNEALASVIFDYKDESNFKTFLVHNKYISQGNTYHYRLYCRINEKVAGVSTLVTARYCGPPAWKRKVAAPVAIHILGRQVRALLFNQVVLTHTFSKRMDGKTIGLQATRPANYPAPLRGLGTTFDYLRVFPIP